MVGYGGHVHEPSLTLVDVDGEIAYHGTPVGRYAELQELMALGERGDVELLITRNNLNEINDVATTLGHGGIEGRA